MVAHPSDGTLLIPGYALTEEVHRGRRRVVYRGTRDRDGASVIVKTLIDPRVGPESVRREYELIRSLELDGVPRALDLLQVGESLALVLEDAGRPRLKSLIPAGGMDIGWFLRLATELSRILQELHDRRIIHKDINPSNILVDPGTGRATLIDFGIASRMPAEHQEPRHPNVLEGTIAYLSPEQTGRMNRDIDYRTDFYSLGVTFYEVLTGRLPFDSSDLLEIIHCHIAKAPPPPSQLRPDIPAPLSGIVMKLLAKGAEERYQSARRLKADLAVCRSEWEASGVISAAVPTPDFGDRLLLPQRLYGRERELGRLMTAFEEVAGGGSRLMLVSGYSGVGKSSLVRELYKPLVSRRGYFIEGKFDQIVRVPYGAILQAFRELIQQLLTEDEDQLARWQTRLAEALGAGAAVLAEVLPEVQLIVGPQPAAPALGPTETQNRFRLVVQNFLRALARREHPLVIFLDDLQWADTATLNLLEPLLAGSEIGCLLLIGAYRDNEVGPAHPLTRAIGGLQAAGVVADHLALEPLELADLVLLVGDTLHREPDDAAPLAGLVAQKTGGNPFFVGQFLKELRDAGLLRFDDRRELWTFEIEAIARAGMTDNVIDLMTGKLQRLSPGTQRVLTLAACIGNPFDQQTLGIVSEQSPEGLRAALEESINEGLVLPAAAASGAAYSFLHDRVQQSAYALIPAERKRTVHLAVGRLLLGQMSRDPSDERIFDVVHHLNLGRGLITDGAERLALARLDLDAGQKAKSATAHEAALGYLSAGIELLTGDTWSSDYELAFTLHLEAAECLYLCGRFEDAEREFSLLLERAATSLDRAKVYRLRGLQYENMSRYADALASALDGLALFGVSFPDAAVEREAALEREMAAVQSLLGGRTIASLVDLPPMTDPGIRMVMNLLTDIWASAYILGHPVLARLISATMVRLSLVHGNAEESAYGYVTHAITVGPVRGDYRSAYEFGRLALQVNERFHDSRRRAKIHQQFHAHVNLWRQPMATCIPYAREACRSGLETGDFLYAAYGASTEAWPAILSTQDLSQFVRDYAPSVAVIRKLKAQSFADALLILLNWARALQGATRGPLSLSSEEMDEEEYLRRYDGNPFFTTFHAVARMHLRYLFGEYQQALDAAWFARGVVYHLSGTIWPVLFDFWNGLTLAANYGAAAEEERRGWLEEMEHARDSLAVLADSCPENFLCQSLLLSGEIERVRGSPLAAFDLYDRAARYAGETGSVQYQALANELSARFWLDRGQAQVAHGFLAQAASAYARWGASAKVAELERRYGVRATRPGTGARPAEPPSDSRTAESTTRFEVGSIDLATVMKAARVLAGEIELERLLERMMAIAIENAGAESGGLVLEHEGTPRVHAQGSGDHVMVQVDDAPPLTAASELPVMIVNSVRRTLESVLLADARTDDRYRHDPYVLRRQPRSVLATPLVNQGRLLGVVYLENNLAAGVFTADRLALIQLLASQAAIALQNAGLYQGLRREIADRTRMEGTLRTITEDTAPLTGVEFFRALTRHAALTLDARYAFLAEVCPDRPDHVATLAFWTDGGFAENITYPLAGTPCEEVVAGEICFHSEGVARLFPLDRDLVTLSAESYLGVPLRNSAGRVIGHLALIHDRPLTLEPATLAVLKIFANRAGAELERQRAEDALRESQLRYSTLAETVPEVLFTNTPDGACDYVSQRFLEYTGMTPEAALGDGWVTAVHPEDRERTAAVWAESTRTGRPFEIEYRVRRADGAYRWFKGHSVPVRDEAGRIVRWFGASTDIDDSKRNEAALRTALAEVERLRDRLQAENVYLQEEIKTQYGFEEIIGRSAPMRRLLQQVEQVAPADTTVLITGETGTGKELVARAIHRLSPRRDRSLVAVNCGAISAGLVESELFGHEKGAFTGAVARKIGRFELADGGTVFLDEIGDLPLELQVKLLRVLQEGEIERVGGTRPIKVNVRVIAATHRDLEEAVASGRFRADLYYRLSVFPIRTPALRERREDVPALTRYFVMKYSAKLGKRIETIPKSALDALTGYAWPGNVRELANVLERSVIISQGTILELGEGAAPLSPQPAPPAGAAGRPLPELTRERILEVLEETGWRVSGPSGAASRLGLKATTLEARMKKLGIARPGARSQSP